MSARLVGFVRLLMGTEFLVNGLNWWVKMVGPYPSLADFAHHAPPADFVGAMIQTGVLFHVVKAAELLAGVALLTNRFVPLMLVVVFPVTVPVFIVDVVLVHHLRGFIMGTGAMLMNTYLMLSYLNCYRSMLVARALPDAASAPTPSPSLPGRATLIYGVVAAAFGVVMLTWVGVMIVQYVSRAA
jgi:hypothetical protein